MTAAKFREARVGHLALCFMLAWSVQASVTQLWAAPYNLAPDGTPFIGIGTDTFGSADNLLVHFGPVTEINDEVYSTGRLGLAPNGYTISPDPDGVSGPQSNGVDSCCNATFGSFHFAGILFNSAVNGVSSIRIQNFIANDGGWWGPATDVAGGAPLPASDIASPQVQVTTNSGASWTDVPTTTSDYVERLTGVVRGTGFPFSTRTPFATITFPTQNGINGIRLIGDGAGAAGGAGGGFIAVTEMIVQQELGVVFPTLDVNTTTGAMTLRTGAGTSRGIKGYTISSDSSVGALRPSGWLSVAANYDAGNPGPNQIDADDPWTVLSSPSSRTLLSEAELAGGNGGVLGANLNLPLGTTWIQNPFGDDLRAEILLNDGSVRRINVTYNGLPSNPLLPGDFNFDGVITPADWPVVRDNFNMSFAGMSRAEAYRFGDINGDGRNDLADFAAFKSLYDAANGAGSFAAMLASQVPEPSSGAMLIFGGLVWLVRTRQRCAGGRTRE